MSFMESTVQVRKYIDHVAGQELVDIKMLARTASNN